MYSGTGMGIILFQSRVQVRVSYNKKTRVFRVSGIIRVFFFILLFNFFKSFFVYNYDYLLYFIIINNNFIIKAIKLSIIKFISYTLN